ncbi:RidA family protein [Oceanobacillus kimchii]|uniref:Endoribonuclease n=1 Tax=Oceanobacillus kimchii TaxID=746691 RepID=A0ABQ5TLQ1_9BACI|nr:MULTISPECIES: RidA family protein [Oceanobacillus]MBT2599525.1 RidA family protein [Oceanobacillus sp. ISL-74]MCT1576711.1 RidA family protein [Oceanobacillus kimchii]MCT2134781.1 RidA family protein [Oceanobacillus kimchii]OEH56078.1 reactive intermediate/imine deaminase [Oceanobacillus sp. E9]GLO67748.1 endoribonuclease [Oceanobacillus kimchii]
MRKAIQTEEAPAAIGPYSQAIQAGDFLYISGQIPINPDSGNVEEGIENQTKQVLNNLNAILEKAEASFDHAVKFTIYLSSMEDFKVVNEIYGKYLQEPYPARATVEVSRLPKDVLIEMDLVAYVK